MFVVLQQQQEIQKSMLELCKNLTITNLTQQPQDIITAMAEQNKNMQNTIIELSKNAGNYNNNKTFNLNFFLNETCKNAINMSDFVNSINLSLDDLENTGKLGYVNGISKVVIDNLNELEQQDRPIHCSDIKRETIYIRNNNTWIKETEDKETLKKFINEIASKNIKKITDWVKEYPEYNNYNSKINDKYLKIVSNSMSGSTPEEQINNINKIISNVVKEITIVK